MNVHAIAAILAVALISPAATAWSGKGQVEPDTTEDRTDGYMWPDTDTTTAVRGTRVYFNAFTVQNTGYGLHGFTINPNVGSLGTAHSNWPGQIAALLGVWKDCNNDGFIGWGDNALFEYRSTLLTLPNVNGQIVGASICPASDPGVPPKGAESHFFPLVHNDGQWVHEFLPIGPAAERSAGTDLNPYDLEDNDARVWADWGKPGDLPPTTRCSVVFVPRGSYSSTGGFLAYVDCVPGFLVTDVWNEAVGSSVGDATPLGQLSFRDSPRDPSSSSSILNRPNPWGRPSDASAVSAFDCSSPQLAHQRVPNTGYEFGVSRPRGAPSVNSGGSIGGTVNETATAMDDCDRSDNQGEWEHQAGAAPYGLEDSGITNQVGAKVRSDFPMAYSAGQRPVPANGPTPLGRATPKDLGTRAWDSEGLWLSGPRYAEDRNPYVRRDGLTLTETAVATTAYAFVGADADARLGLDFNPTNALGTYGSKNCFTSTSGVRTGWQCDPNLWPPCGAHYTCSGTIGGLASVDISVKVGQAYQLQDVDCYDQSTTHLRNEGVHWGALTQTTCW